MPQDVLGRALTEYCRQWIDRVEPFFVCILGQRYGWVPEPERLKDREDRERQQVEQRSITDMEVRHAVLNTKLNRRSYFYLRATEAPLTASEYVDPPPLSSKLEQLKSDVRACSRPVRDYPCEWTGSSFAAMEEFGRVVCEDLWSGVLRDERYVSKEVWCQVHAASLPGGEVKSNGPKQLRFFDSSVDGGWDGVAGRFGAQERRTLQNMPRALITSKATKGSTTAKSGTSHQ